MYQLKNHTTEETIAELKCLRKWVNSRPDEVEERIAQSEKQKKKRPNNIVSTRDSL